MGSKNGDPIIEGVRGQGSDFMLGTRGGELLPERVHEAARALYRDVSRAFGSGTKIEWAFDGADVWILQLQLTEAAVSQSIIVAGEANRFHSFDVTRGLDDLRTLVQSLKDSGEGVELVGHVGITSHFGDVLRRARVPSRLTSLQ